MAFNDFTAESPENFEQKCLCVLTLDVSGSMAGNPISQLNAGLMTFHKEIRDGDDEVLRDRLEISIIEFGSKVKCIQEPALADNFNMPKLSVKGTTKMVEGVRAAIEKVEARKEWYKSTEQPYYRPWIILITDGAPDDDQDVVALAEEIQRGGTEKKFVFLAVGVKGADMKVLSKIAQPGMPPTKLQGFKFSDFFRWLSNSMGTITSRQKGEKVSFEKPDWMEEFTIE